MSRLSMKMTGVKVNGEQSGEFDGTHTAMEMDGPTAALQSEFEAVDAASFFRNNNRRLPTPSSPITISDERFPQSDGSVEAKHRVRRDPLSESSPSTSEQAQRALADQAPSISDGGRGLSLRPALATSDQQQQHRRLTDESEAAAPATIGHAIPNQTPRTDRKRTLVVYSGPTSLDPTVGKNGVYLTNFDYFIEHGIECHGLGGTTTAPARPFEDLHLQYVVVLTREVADRYTAEDGLITRKQAECRAARRARQRERHDHAVASDDDARVTVLVREDRCYDMESLLLVARTYDLPRQYDHMVYLNCGLAGPRFGPGSPERWERLASWTELYTALLSDTVQMVGHTINTHFNTVHAPHIQSFLFAVNTAVVDVWLETGAVYECGISNEDFKDDLVKMALVWRYEVGLSRVLLERGYSIAAAFVHQRGRLGEPLIIDQNSTFGLEFGADYHLHSDVFLEDNVRELTASTFPGYADHRRYAILPWDAYVFFKVSRLIPGDIQAALGYARRGPVRVVPNDARRSAVRRWRRRAGVSALGEVARFLPGAARAPDVGALGCFGRHCRFEEAAATMGEMLWLAMLLLFVLWYATTTTFVRRRIVRARSKEIKWVE